MFEREIKFIYDFNLNKVNKLGPYFTFEQLQSVDLHPAILHYISAEIDYLVFEDRQKLLKNSVFDYSGEKISYHFNEISEELKKIKRFSLEYIAKLILHSTSFTINFLVRPKWTLTRFIFDEAKHKTSSEIKQILNYIYYYKFQKKIIVSYINSKKILSMNSEEFEDLLDKSDKLGMETNFKGILSHSLISMAEFFNIGQMQKTKIPVTAVELFLEEKDLPYHLQKMNDMFGSDENARFNIGDYMKILTSVMPVQKEEEKEKEQLILFDEQPEEILAETEIEAEENFVDENIPSPVPEELIAKEEIESAESEFIENDTSLDIDNEEPVLNELVEYSSSVETESEEEDFLKKWQESKELEDSENEWAETAVEKNEVTIKPEPEKDDEQIIKQYSKIRININENNRIEPVREEEIESPEAKLIEEPADEFDSYTTIFKGENDSLEGILDISGDNSNEDIDLDSYEITTELPVEENEPEKPVQSFSELLEEEEKELEQNENEEPSSLEDVIEFNHDLENIEEEETVHDDKQAKLELAEVLEHKNMTKIIETVFDYDIEDFANMLDEISNCKNIDDANYVITETLSNRRINLNSKEAGALKDIISEYFSRK